MPAISNPLVKATLLETGKRLTSGALAGFSRFAPHSFKCGATADFTFSPSEVAHRGSLVYTGSASLIQTRIVTFNTVRYTCVLPEGVGPFTFGNLVLFSSDFNGEPIPFVGISFPFALTKTLSDPNWNNSNPFPKPGNRLVISITVTHSEITDDSRITVNLLTPTYSNLPFFEDETVLPPAESQPWPQFVLHNHTSRGMPVFVSKRDDDTYWGAPMQNIQHPHFGFIDGGVSGDSYQTSQHAWLDGRYYTTLAGQYSGVMGGMGYTDIAQFPDSIIGGATY